MHKTKPQTTFLISAFCVLILSYGSAFSQRRYSSPVGYGAAVIYNFETQGLGIDVRARIPVWNNLYAVPEVSWFPPFDNYHELYAGVALQYDVYQLGNYNLYLAGGGYYNLWFNADKFYPGRGTQKNIVPEAGLGLVRNNGCLRPFIESRYDFKWKEYNLRIGIYLYPGSCGRKREKCPKVPT